MPTLTQKRAVLLRQSKMLAAELRQAILDLKRAGGITQADIADRLGVTPQYVGKVLRQERVKSQP